MVLWYFKFVFSSVYCVFVFFRYVSGLSYWCFSFFFSHSFCPPFLSCRIVPIHDPLFFLLSKSLSHSLSRIVPFLIQSHIPHPSFFILHSAFRIAHPSSLIPSFPHSPHTLTPSTSTSTLYLAHRSYAEPAPSVLRSSLRIRWARWYGTVLYFHSTPTSFSFILFLSHLPSCVPFP